MERILAMDYSQIQYMAFLLLILNLTSQETAADSQLRLQNVYPGCKRSPNHSDTSASVCSNSVFLDESLTHLPEFKEFIINTTQLTDCFVCTSDKIFSYSALNGYIAFDGTIPADALVNFSMVPCSCEVVLSGPPNTVFQIEIVRDHLSVEYSIDSIYDYTYYEYNYYLERETYQVSSTNNSVHIKFSPQNYGNVSFNFTIRAFPDPECQKQLEIHCLSETSGLIETPLWRNGSEYRNNMDSCVAVHVPQDHLIMISLISIDVEKIYDYLTLHRNHNCTGEERRIYAEEDLPPTVIKGISVVSIGFSSDGTITKAGFRLLYSIYKSSEEPQQLPNGKWDCSVPYYKSFQKHFVCHPELFCSDGRDKVVCPQDDICGVELMMLGESCYRFFPSNYIAWNDASDKCMEYGGHLAAVHRPADLQLATDLFQKHEVNENIFIGLRVASTSKLHEMYQNTWLWSDETLAVYLPIRVHRVNPPYCASIFGSNLTMVSCQERMSAAYLCEQYFRSPNQTQKPIQITMPVVSYWPNGSLTTCPLGHLTHTFLACDVSANCHAKNEQKSLLCSNGFSPPIPLFTCRNWMDHVPYSLVCNFRSDCCDGSDEDFCVFPACEGRKYYQCSEGNQCISQDLVCNKRRDCVDGSDESNCWEVFSKFELMGNTVNPPAVVDFTGFGNFTVTPTTSSHCPDTHFKCPGDGYCLPIYTRCNTINDCSGKEDEMDCDLYTCPGFYRCRDSKICLHRQHLCDKVFQCPQHDDELMCNFTCPETCDCYGHAFICTDFFTPGNHLELRYLDASNTGMSPEDLLNNTKLIYLNLKNCGIAVIGELDFPNLQSLDLRDNRVRELTSGQFSKLGNLVSLSLANNPVVSLASLVYGSLKFSKLATLDLSDIQIPEINEAFVNTFPSVRDLKMHGSGVKQIAKLGFRDMKNLYKLDLQDCPVETFFPGVFDGLNQLDTIYTDNYKLCCPAVLPEGMHPENCYAPTDEISSCDALLRADVFRVFLAIYAFLALTGNLGSFIYRVFFEKGTAKMGYEVFVTHLCVADFLMGVYLAIIGIADRYYFGNYRWNDVIWKHSMACKVAGVLSLVSSEVSAYLICLITLERFLVITFPHKNLRFSQRSANAACLIVWLIGLVLALIPFLPMLSHWNFYSQSGICVPLPVTRKKFAGSDYAFAVIIVVNFVLFLFIAAGQLLIYWSIRMNTVSSKDSRKKSKDMAVARRLLAVVMTDFMCWFPIGLLGVLAQTGVPIPSEINVVLAIFVLPFNSALNPFLYTFNIVMERRRNLKRVQKSSNEQEPRYSQNTSRVYNIESENMTDETYSKEEAFLLFKSFLEDGLLTPEQIRRRVWEIYEG